jgi:hypothetical protein
MLSDLADFILKISQLAGPAYSWLRQLSQKTRALLSKWVKPEVQKALKISPRPPPPSRAKNEPNLVCCNSPSISSKRAIPNTSFPSSHQLQTLVAPSAHGFCCLWKGLPGSSRQIWQGWLVPIAAPAVLKSGSVWGQIYFCNLLPTPSLHASLRLRKKSNTKATLQLGFRIAVRALIGVS